MAEAMISWTGVLAATLAQMVIGMIWYNPNVFGSEWMRLTGKTMKDMEKAKQKGMALNYLGALLGAFVTAYVLRMFVDYSNAGTWLEGAMTGAWVWLGFLATSSLSMVLWDGKPVKLWTINNGQMLLSMLVSGALVAAL